jgi:hypothetical protein
MNFRKRGAVASSCEPKAQAVRPGSSLHDPRMVAAPRTTTGRLDDSTQTNLEIRAVVPSRRRASRRLDPASRFPRRTNQAQWHRNYDQ